MSKAEISKLISTKTGLPGKESAEILEQVLELIKKTLTSGEEVKIAGFGKFECRQKRQRRGRNPQTGAAITLSGRRIVIFKASTILKTGMNK